MEGVLLPLNIMVLLELEELAPLDTVLNSWVEDLRLFEPLAVKVVVPGGKSHFGLDEDEREEPALPTPFGCCKMARKGLELLDEVLHGVEGWLPYNCFEQYRFHPPSHNHSDRGHGCRGCCRVYAVLALKGII